MATFGGRGTVVSECTHPCSFSAANSKAINTGCGISFLYNPRTKTFKEELLFVPELHGGPQGLAKKDIGFGVSTPETPITVKPLSPLGP